MKKYFLLISLLIFPIFLSGQNLNSQYNIGIGLSEKKSFSIEALGRFNSISKLSFGLEYVKNNTLNWGFLFPIGWFDDNMGCFLKLGPTFYPKNSEEEPKFNYGVEFLYSIGNPKFSPVLGASFTKEAGIQIKLGVIFK